MLRLVSFPADMPVTVADLRRHARVDALDDDGVLELYLHSAIEQVERAAGVGFIGATWEWTADEFPAECIRLGMAPVTLVSIAYTDAAANPQTVSLTDVTVSGGMVEGDWPDGTAVKVTFTAGDGSVPAPIRTAILMTAVSAYEDRLEGGELTGPAQRLVGQYRRVWF